MMKSSILMAATLLCTISFAFGQTAESSYAGQQSRKIKTLSADEITGYLSGHGMGFAKAAELNRYPGPKHVMDLAEKLALTKDQAGHTTEIYHEMHLEATRLGRVYVDLEKKLDQMFASKSVTEDTMRDLISEISRVRGEIRMAHLIAHLRMVQVLGSEQIAKYDELRGYTDRSQKPGHEPGHGH
jgi:hypothetical protein